MPLGNLGFFKGPPEAWHRTSYHRRFVEVPRDLRVQKSAGEPVTVALTRSGDTVDVTELR